MEEELVSFVAAPAGAVVCGAVKAVVSFVGDDGTMAIAVDGLNERFSLLPPTDGRPFWIALVYDTELKGLGLATPDAAVNDLLEAARQTWVRLGERARVSELPKAEWRMLCVAAALLKAAMY